MEDPLTLPAGHWRSCVTPRRVAVALLAAFAVLAMMLTSGQMAELRLAIPQLSEAMSWLEVLDLPFDMDHVAFFMPIAFAVRLLLARIPWWWLLLGLGVLAAGTELLQFATHGRTPKVLDARDDMVGAAIGLLLGQVLLWMVRATRSYRRLRRSKAAP